LPNRSGQSTHLSQHRCDRIRQRLSARIQVSRERFDQRRGHHRRVGNAGGHSGVRTPNPMAIGRSVTRRSCGIAATKCSTVALVVPVIEVMVR
jgi:hypothetical protein